VTVTTLAVGLALLAAFAAWEARSRHPVLNVRLFANPRFTWATVGFGLVGLVLTGAMFLFTQYLQDVEGYRPYDSGLRMIPLVVGMLVGAQAVSRLLPRIGTKAAMAAGFTLLAAGLALFGIATVDTGYGFVALCLTLMGAGLGMAMTPGLDAIMGAMPAGEFGAGSAVASTFRQVGGAIGVALLGDIYLNRYMATLHLPTALPASVAHIARQSVGAANAVAAKLPAPLAGQVRGEAHAAFMSGLDWTLLLAAGVAVVAAGLVAAFLPGRKPAAPALKPPMPEVGRDRPRPGRHDDEDSPMYIDPALTPYIEDAQQFNSQAGRPSAADPGHTRSDHSRTQADRRTGGSATSSSPSVNAAGRRTRPAQQDTRPDHPRGTAADRGFIGQRRGRGVVIG